jgi:hypothetical protein
MDQALLKIYEKPNFQKYLKLALEKNRIRKTDYEKCLGGLYHSTSKHAHGTQGVLTIFTSDWSSVEQFALATLFKAYDVQFVFNKQGTTLVEPPFDLSDFERVLPELPKNS